MDLSLITSSYRRRQSDGIERREDIRHGIPNFFARGPHLALKKSQILITFLT